jgi:uncharacterized RDD family membrane protein YckC
MKCPKCGYLGFETTDRCRHCGYDFSLAVPVEPASELPLRTPGETESPLADFDLDRVIGETAAASADAGSTPSRLTFRDQAAPEEVPPLPLFNRERPTAGDAAFIATPPPARPPLAVRRATPEVARRRTPRTPRRDEGLELQLEPAASAAAHTDAPGPATEVTGLTVPTAPTARRVVAAIVDLLLLGCINAAILYLTLAIVGLPMADVTTLPPIPMVAFLLLLDIGYLVAFTAAHGQTIGKMLLSVRVIGDDDRRVDIAGSFVRAAGVLLTVVTFGIAYLPVLLSRDGRALHDRLARTRVIRHA